MHIHQNQNKLAFDITQSSLKVNEQMQQATSQYMVMNGSRQCVHWACKRTSWSEQVKARAWSVSSKTTSVGSNVDHAEVGVRTVPVYSWDMPWTLSAIFLVVPEGGRLVGALRPGLSILSITTVGCGPAGCIALISAGGVSCGNKHLE
eukprot:scaffold408212_cov41-Prasinocladus_malaysianus.AAC.1